MFFNQKLTEKEKQNWKSGFSFTTHSQDWLLPDMSNHKIQKAKRYQSYTSSLRNPTGIGWQDLKQATHVWKRSSMSGLKQLRKEEWATHNASTWFESVITSTWGTAVTGKWSTESCSCGISIFSLRKLGLVDFFYTKTKSASFFIYSGYLCLMLKFV